MKNSLVCLVLFLSPAVHAMAKNVDLSTVPPRETVQLTIYNSEDLTLVRETRRISLKQGVNPLQFSWANTLIDPTSVDLRFKTHADELDLLDTTFPHDKPQMLYWNVQSDLGKSALTTPPQSPSDQAWHALPWQAPNTASWSPETCAPSSAGRFGHQTPPAASVSHRLSEISAA